MLDKNIKEEITKLAHDLLKIRRGVQLGTVNLTPTNLLTEKEKFLNNKTKNPLFTYSLRPFTDPKQDIQRAYTNLKQLDLPHDLFSYFEDYVESLERLSKVVSHIGKEDFGVHASQLFRWEIVDAEEIISDMDGYDFPHTKGSKVHSADAMQAYFTKVFIKEYGIQDFTVRTDDFNPLTIRVEFNSLVIGSHVRRNSFNVKRLIVHELESHALQNYNLRNSRNPLHRITPYDQKLLHSEGLAVYNEYITGTLTQKALDTYYYRLKAVDLLDKSFREIYSYLVEYLDEDHAFLMTYRVKRGLSDTSLSGGYPKDAAYLLGFKKIKEFVEMGGDLRLLYITKVPYLAKLLDKYGLLSDELIALPKFIEEVSEFSLVH